MSTARPRLSLVAAMAENRVIGVGNRLPWHLPADLAHFKQLTLGKPMLMGRKTWESLPGLLPGRPHIVITRDPNYPVEGARIANSLDAALEMTAGSDEVMVIGGAEIYRQALPLADDLYLTLVHAAPGGDVFFPDLPDDRWQLRGREDHAADARNPFAYSFLHYQP